MSRSTWLVVTALAAVGLSFLASDRLRHVGGSAAVLRVVPEVQDLSFMSLQPSTKVVAQFEFQNTSSLPLTISEIRAGCNCSNVQCERPLPCRLGAGEALKCAVLVSPVPSPDAQSLPVIALGVDGAGAPKECRAILKYECHAPLKAEPAVLALGAVKQAGGVVEKRLAVYRASDAPAESDQFQIEADAGLSVVIEPAGQKPRTDEHYSHLCDLVVQLDLDRVGDRISRRIRLLKSSETWLEIPVYGWRQSANGAVRHGN